MVGEIIGIIDESIYQVMIQVFPNKRCVPLFTKMT